MPWILASELIFPDFLYWPKLIIIGETFEANFIANQALNHIINDSRLNSRKADELSKPLTLQIAEHEFRIPLEEPESDHKPIMLIAIDFHG